MKIFITGKSYDNHYYKTVADFETLEETIIYIQRHYRPFDSARSWSDFSENLKSLERFYVTEAKI